MHEVEIYRGGDTTLIEALRGAMEFFCVEFRIEPVLGPEHKQLHPVCGGNPISRITLTPVRAIKSDLLNELRCVPSHVLNHAEGFIAG